MAADPGAALAASIARVRRAIVQIAEQRVAAERTFATLVVNEARLQRLLREQRGYLEDSMGEIARAGEFANAAAARVRAEGADAAPYEQTAAALQRQADVVDAARRQLADAEAAGRDNMARARQLFDDNLARLENSLREQLELLVRLEELDRRHGAADARVRQRWQVGHQ
jgi:hypothetical protein